MKSLVLCYHTLSRTWNSPVAVHPDDFRWQLESLLRAGFRAVTFTEAVTRPDHRNVAITFDDAFLAVFELALPILDEYRMVATMFAPTQFVASGAALEWDGYGASERGPGREMSPMSWEHLRALSSRGWEIGSHTRSHPHLPRLTDAELMEELRLSREECTAGTGTTCTTLAYPYGDVTRRVRDAAERAGYTFAAALGPQWRRGDPLWWPRTGVYRGDSSAQFHFKASLLARSRVCGAGVAAVRQVVGSGR